MVSFEEALTISGTGCYTYRLLFICLFLLVAVVTEIFGHGYIVTSSMCDLALTTSTKGVVVAMPMLGIVLSGNLWGWMADTHGRKTVLLISMIGSWVISICSSLSGVWFALAIFGFLMAFFVSATNTVGFALLGECTPLSHRNMFLIFVSSGMFIGMILNSGLAFIILRLDFDVHIPMLDVHYRPWRLLGQVYGLSSGIGAFLLIVFVKESPKYLMSRGREADSLKVLSEMFSINSGRKPEDYPIKNIVFEEATVVYVKRGVLASWWLQVSALFRPPLMRRTFVIAYVFIVVFMITPSIMMWMPAIANKISLALHHNVRSNNFCDLLYKGMKLTNTTVFRRAFKNSPDCVNKVENITYMVIACFATLAVAMTTVFGFAVRVVNKRTLIITTMSISGACGMVQCLVFDQYSGMVLFTAFLLNVVCMGVITSFTVVFYPTYLRATAICVMMMMGRASSFLFINSIGYLFRDHCNKTLFGGGFILFSAALVAFLLPKDQSS